MSIKTLAKFIRNCIGLKWLIGESTPTWNRDWNLARLIIEKLTPYFPYPTKIKKEIHDAVQPWGIRNLTDFRQHAQYRLLLVITRFKRCAFMSSGAGHRSVTFCDCAVICFTVFPALIACRGLLGCAVFSLPGCADTLQWTPPHGNMNG